MGTQGLLKLFNFWLRFIRLRLIQHFQLFFFHTSIKKSYMSYPTYNLLASDHATIPCLVFIYKGAFNPGDGISLWVGARNTLFCKGCQCTDFVETFWVNRKCTVTGSLPCSKISNSRTWINCLSVPINQSPCQWWPLKLKMVREGRGTKGPSTYYLDKFQHTSDDLAKYWIYKFCRSVSM